MSGQKDLRKYIIICTKTLPNPTELESYAC